MTVEEFREERFDIFKNGCKMFDEGNYYAAMRVFDQLTTECFNAMRESGRKVETGK